MSGASFVTVEEFAAMSQEREGIDELIAGHIYYSPVPSFEHGECLAEIGSRVIEFVKANSLGRCSTLSGLIVGRNPDSVLCPDFQFMSVDRPPDVVRGWPTVPPRLIIEVVQGVNEYNHALLKMPYYLAFGVDQIWVVGLRRRLVEITRLLDHPEPFDPWEWRSVGYQRVQYVNETGTLDGGDVLPGFSCKVADLFV